MVHFIIFNLIQMIGTVKNHTSEPRFTESVYICASRARFHKDTALTAFCPTKKSSTPRATTQVLLSADSKTI